MQIALRELILLVVIAGVRLHPDYLWLAVAPQIRARLYDRLSFGRRDLGQDVTAGEIIAAIHTVPGVVYADLDLLDGLSGADVAGPNLAARLAQLAQTPPGPMPAPARASWPRWPAPTATTRPSCSPPKWLSSIRACRRR